MRRPMLPFRGSPGRSNQKTIFDARHHKSVPIKIVMKVLFPKSQRRGDTARVRNARELIRQTSIQWIQQAGGAIGGNRQHHRVGRQRTIVHHDFIPLLAAPAQFPHRRFYTHRRALEPFHKHIDQVTEPLAQGDERRRTGDRFFFLWGFPLRYQQSSQETPMLALHFAKTRKGRKQTELVGRPGIDAGQ